jgi:hypothetical protein
VGDGHRAALAVTDVRVVGLLAVGIAGGLALLVRGFGGYRAAGRIAGVAPSRISALAVGEVLITGVAEAIELTLISPLQSAACVYYRSRVTDPGENGGVVFHEERAVGFRVRDQSGAVRVFPAGAEFGVPNRYDERTSMFDGYPPGLQLRNGSAFAPGTDRDAQIARLLISPDGRDPFATGGADAGPLGERDQRRADDLWLLERSPALVGGTLSLAAEGRSRRYEEARIEPGDQVTVLGRALPFGDLADPGAAYLLEAGLPAADDPEIAADLAAARAAGTLTMSPAEAWGNAAIEGFGIGRPLREPELDPRANPLPLGDASLAARARDAFDIPPEALVLATNVDSSLAISLGAPASVVAREQGRFIVGLLGAVLAIGCAVVLALLLAGSAA